MEKIRRSFEQLSPALKVLVFILCFYALLVASGMAGAMFPKRFNSLLFGILGTLSGLATLFIFKYVDPENWKLSGTNWQRATVLRFMIGLLIGIGIFIPMIAALIALSSLQLTYSPDTFNVQALLTLLPILPLALMEELGFRSYPQQVLFRKYGIWTSQISMAVVFSITHIFYGWSPSTAFMGPFVWAFLFGLSAIAFKGIAVPTGIHFSLNVLQALTGLKGEEPFSFFKLDFPASASQVSMEAAERFGLWLQGAVFILFILLTFLYNRYLNNKTDISKT